MIGRLLRLVGRLPRRGRRARPEDRLDELAAAIDVKLQALLVTATQAIAEAVRAELARGRQRAAAGSSQAEERRARPPARSLLDLESDGAAADARRAFAALSAARNVARTETRP